MKKNIEILEQILLDVVDKSNSAAKNSFLEICEALKNNDNQSIKIKSIFKEVSNSIHLSDIIKVFSLHNIILNINEEQEDIQNKSKLSLDSVYEILKNQGFDKVECDLVLKHIRFYPVFTAHPTESRRRTFLEAHSEISRHLSELDQISFMPKELKVGLENKIYEEIKYRLHLLWLTNLVRTEKIEVSFELDNLLYIVENSILSSALDILNQVSKLLDENLIKSPIKLGSWIGGDRDGNPFITNEIMTGVMKAQHKLILNVYIKEVDKLIRELSISQDFCNIEKDLIKSIQKEKDHLDKNSIKLYTREPFRAKLNLIKIKLKNHLLGVNSPTKLDFTYKNPKELIKDIDLLINSLDKNSSKRLSSFRNLVLLGGFHLLQLDFREHRDVFVNAVGEIFCLTGLSDSDFPFLSEDKKMEILNKAFLNPPINLMEILDIVSPSTNRLLEAFLRVKWAKKYISKDILKSFIVSMSTNPSDLMCVLYLLYASELWKRGDEKNGENKLGRARIKIAPLFETIQDLEKAKEIMEILNANNHYGAYLKDCKGMQEIMIGYSDSSKDGGIFASNYSLHKSITNLVKLESKLGIRFVLFHGKGGSISRGGGQLEDALLAFPSGSVGTTLKVTEQGEMISSKYLNPLISKESLSSTLASLLKKCVMDNLSANTSISSKRSNFCNIDIYNTILNKISKTSLKVYRELVYEHDNFLTFFKQATPLEFIQRLNLGSRPSKRRDSTKIEDLRAIPWVFAWTQNRSIIPAWYGLGSALEKIDSEELRECYLNSLFFKTTIDNITQGFLKVDLGISSLYEDFVTDSGLRSKIDHKIMSEYQKTLKGLLIIRGEEELLDSNAFLRNKILSRMPNLRALNLLQIELIRKFNNAEYESLQNRIIEQIHGTIIGIAQGMRNTG